MVDLEHARERLREWAFHYRDRARKGQSGSAERMWRSPQCWDAPQPKPAHDFRRAVQTHDLLRDHVPVPNVRALTYRYCWPWLPLGIPLRHLTRRLGYRIGPREYEQLVAIGEYRIAVLLAGGEASLQRERAVRATLALRSGAGPSGPKWRGVARHG